jgi:Bacterial PH domain
MKIALKDMEHIRQIYRQSPFVLVHPVGLSGLVIILPLYAIIRFNVWRGFLGYALIGLSLLVLMHALRVFIIWRLNTYVITNQRLLHYGQKGLFDQTVTETPLERILNVSYKTEGIISTMIGYGDVIVQVVGLMEPIILKNIDTPMAIKDYLWEMHKRIASDKSGSVFAEADASHVQESVGYTKNNHI